MYCISECLRGCLEKRLKRGDALGGVRFEGGGGNVTGGEDGEGPAIGIHLYVMLTPALLSI